jgi:hypothetical protein
LQQPTSFLPYFNNKTTSVASSEPNINLITSFETPVEQRNEVMRLKLKGATEVVLSEK